MYLGTRVGGMSKRGTASQRGRMRVLVTNGGVPPFYRNVLGICRTQGRTHEVFVALPRVMPGLVRRLRPKACADVLFVVDAHVDPLGFADDIARLQQRYGFDALLPCSDPVATVFAQGMDALGAGVPLPPIARLMQAIDKGKTLEVAREAGVPVPRTTFGTDRKAVLGWMAANGIAFPVIVKPRIKGGLGTVLAADADALAAHLQAFNAAPDDYPYSCQTAPLVQERIPGVVHDCCALYWHGKAKAMLSQLRLRTPFALGGVGAVNRTTRNTEVMALSRTLLDALQWHGPAQLEWIHDAGDDQYKLIEINPRFWGTVELATEAGVDFPGLTLALMAGQDVAQPEYTVGLTHRWVLPEQLQGVLNARDDRLRRLLELVDIRDLWNPEVRFTFDPRDPKPDLLRLIYFARAAGAKLLGRA
jgi:predicted ATP-grasp superfamily ATP-dependent carboligase